MENFGRLDVLMNVAGINKSGKIQNVARADIDTVIDINLKGLMIGCHAAAPIMLEQGSGHIVNVASFSSFAAATGMSLYVASKTGVRGFSLAIAQDLAPHGIAVTAIYPDKIMTPMLEIEAFREDVEMNFATGSFLTLDDLERAVFNVALPKRPRELLVPGHQSLTMRLFCAFPSLGQTFMPYFKRQGQRNQKRYQARLQKK